MGKKLKALIACCLPVVYTACGSMTAAGSDQPALLIEVTPEVIEELQQALVDASSGAPVTIADDVFTKSSLLALEQGRLADGPGRPLTGRDLLAPRIFRLVKNAQGCWLVREADSQRWSLRNASCVSENG
ncbi:hypothetical protein Mag101_03820 [Microbulbifer agarilyticus]|uniref:Surface antigen domain-containing protein n=1 Tax=Microbulbifer agarilyticus TaxID=260552 RepID=A0A1Q2M3R8_9GAMM|nr:hypothetical protein [Microbulbifer agarilyticus]AQQ66862.1 hypothetical protein Mag101_03820 [Microbulbifer agarilyticus]